MRRLRHDTRIQIGQPFPSEPETRVPAALMGTEEKKRVVVLVRSRGNVSWGHGCVPPWPFGLCHSRHLRAIPWPEPLAMFPGERPAHCTRVMILLNGSGVFIPSLYQDARFPLDFLYGPDHVRPEWSGRARVPPLTPWSAPGFARAAAGDGGSNAECSP